MIGHLQKTAFQRIQFARIHTVPLINIEKTLNRPTTKVYNDNDINVIAAELRLTKTRPSSLYKNQKFWKLNVKNFAKKFFHRLLYIESDFWIISSKKFLKCSFVYLPACPLLILDPKLTQTRHFSDYCLI